MNLTVLKRVQALMERAQSSFEEEARTAAFLAVQLIREHNLLVSPKEPKLRAQPRPKKSPKLSARAKVRVKSEALDKVERLMDFWAKKAEEGQYPYFTSKELTKTSLGQGLIRVSEQASFNHYLTQDLRDKVSLGFLVFQPTQGFRLAYRSEEESEDE